MRYRWRFFFVHDGTGVCVCGLGISCLACIRGFDFWLTGLLPSPLLPSKNIFNNMFQNVFLEPFAFRFYADCISMDRVCWFTITPQNFCGFQSCFFFSLSHIFVGTLYRFLSYYFLYFLHLNFSLSCWILFFIFILCFIGKETLVFLFLSLIWSWYIFLFFVSVFCLYFHIFVFVF